MPFLNDLNVKFVRGKELVKLDEELQYETKWGTVISIPAGFVSDLASIPRIFQGVISKFGKHRRAAVLHDYLYYTGQYLKGLADLLFYQAMGEDGVAPFKRSMMYWAVKNFGGWAWKQHRKRDARNPQT